MSIVYKNNAEIEKMAIAGRLAAEVLEMIEPYVQAGISTDELNEICHNHIVNVQQAVPAPLGYQPDGFKTAFPKSICTSVNEIVCHGIPTKSKILRNGDIINIDVTVIKDGWHGDTSKMFYVGKPSPDSKRLVEATKEALYVGIEQAIPGNTLNHIAKAIEKVAAKNRLAIVAEYCGHGIGLEFHEDPQVIHCVSNYNNVEIKPGMTFTIEPILNLGHAACKTSKKDGWTVITRDNKFSAQWEHTIAILNTGNRVLTKRSYEPFA